MENLKQLYYIFIVIIFAGCIEPPEEECKLYSIRTELLRSKYIEDMISNIKATKFLGGADSGFSGGGDLFEAIQKQSIIIFPDGEYFYQDTRTVSEFKYQGYVYWGRYSGHYSSNAYIHKKL